MAKKITHINSKHLEGEQPLDHQLAQDERLREILGFIAFRRNVFFKFDIESDATIPRAISLLESREIRVWHREARSLTLDDVAPQVLENGEPTYEDHHIWDEPDVVFLRHCEDIYRKPDICMHLLVTVANLEMYNKLPVVVMTHSGGLPDYRKTCKEYENLEQRLLNQIV